MSSLVFPTFKNGLPKRTTRPGRRRVRVGVDNEGYVRVLSLVVVEKMDKLGVDNDGIGISMVKNIRYILGFQAVVNSDVDSACGSNAKY
jgi:hypothetical protein